MDGYPARKRQRLRDFNYAAAGSYFVTICTANRAQSLNGEVATIVVEELNALSLRFRGVSVREHILMEDHIHVILDLDGCSRSLPRIIQAFKSITTVRAGRADNRAGERLWQRGYYDRVIRDESELLAIREYIQQNPLAEQIKSHT